MRRRRGTTVRFPDGQVVHFPLRLTEAEAIRRAMKVRKTMQNPVADPLEHAAARFEEFNGKPPTELVKMKLDLRHLINIGRVPEIHYTSRKEGGKPIHYVHFLKTQGTMYAHPDGGLFLTIAPSTKVRDWLEEENPNRLSQSNIDRATQQYERLSVPAKQRITDVKAYIMKIAWQIQRGRVKAHGHR